MCIFALNSNRAVRMVFFKDIFLENAPVPALLTSFSFLTKPVVCNGPIAF